MAGPGLIDYPEILEELWRRVAAAADDQAHPMRLFTLATADEQGRPDARIMSLRGASRPTNRLWFHTDKRSRKSLQLRSQPLVCAVAYDPRDGVQLRLNGSVTLHEHDELAQQLWEQTELIIRNAYGRTAAPGEPAPHPDPRWAARKREIDSGNEDVGRNNFVVLELAVETIDWLQVRQGEERRAVMRRADQWRVQPVAP